MQFRDGLRLFEQNAAKKIAADGDWITAEIAYGERTIETRFRPLRDGTVDTACPCRDARDRGLICAHVVAAGLAYADEISDPQHDREQRIAKRREREKMTGPAAGYVRRIPQKHAMAIPAQLQLWISQDWRETVGQGNVTLSAHVIAPRGRDRIDRIGTHPWFAWSPRDEMLLYLMEDIMRGPLPGRMTMPLEGFLHLLTTLAPGEIFVGEGREKVRVSDKKTMPLIRVSLSDSGEIVIEHEIEGVRNPLMIATRRIAWIFADDTFSQLEQVLPPAFQDAYRGQMRIPRTSVPAFLRRDLPVLEQTMLIESKAGIGDLEFTPGEPSFKLVLRGSPDQLVSTLYAVYGADLAAAGRGLPDENFTAPDPTSPRRYLTRNEKAEQGSQRPWKACSPR